MDAKRLLAVIDRATQQNVDAYGLAVAVMEACEAEHKARVDAALAAALEVITTTETERLVRLQEAVTQALAITVDPE